MERHRTDAGKYTGMEKGVEPVRYKVLVSSKQLNSDQLKLVTKTEVLRFTNMQKVTY